MKGLLCPQCKKEEGMCYCYDVGGVDYHDEYTFFCNNCGYCKKETKYGGSPVAADWPTNCPFCDKPYNEHHGTPQELWGY